VERAGPTDVLADNAQEGDEARRIPRPECLRGLPFPAWPLEADDDSPSCRPVANYGGARPPHSLIQRPHINGLCILHGHPRHRLDAAELRASVAMSAAAAPAACAKQGLTKQAQLLGDGALA
jgi:hypothetical protein